VSFLWGEAVHRLDMVLAERENAQMRRGLAARPGE
jgi:hypothetical protein